MAMEDNQSPISADSVMVKLFKSEWVSICKSDIMNVFQEILQNKNSGFHYIKSLLLQTRKIIIIIHYGKTIFRMGV